MQKIKLTLILLIMLLSFFFIIIFKAKEGTKPIIGYSQPNSKVIPMPIVLDMDPETCEYKWYAPKEDRDQQYYKYLAVSLKVSVSGGSGSGTIIYYDNNINEAYIISCGHLWNGSKSAEEVAKNPVTCKVTTWFHNEIKLSNPKEYSANVLFWSNRRGYDLSLIKFKPDWKPNYFPIAPINYDLDPGTLLNSCGCDGGREVARYEVEIVGMRGSDLVTKRNSPRPGRSGGGLITNDGKYVGICWGTTDTTGGNGIGLFTPLSSIYEYYQNNGYEFLLNVTSNNGFAQEIPILHDNIKFPKQYIPMPNVDFIIKK